MDPITIVLIGGGLAFAGNYALKEMAPSVVELCYQPAPLVRVCQKVQKSEVEERIAEAMAATSARQRLASGQIVR